MTITAIIALLTAFFAACMNITYSVRYKDSHARCYVMLKGVVAGYFVVIYSFIIFGCLGFECAETSRVYLRPGLIVLLFFLALDAWIRPNGKRA